MNKNAERARRALLEREARQTVFFIKEFKTVQKRIEADIDATLKAIDEQKAAGEISGSTVARNLRLNEILKQVRTEIRAMSATLAAVVENGQRSGVKIAKAQAAETPRIQAGLNYFDSDATKKLIGIAGDGQPLRQIFDKLAPTIGDAVVAELTNGVATGLSTRAIAQNINNAVGRGTVNAMTIARTETNRAYREASRGYYDETPGVIGWRWQAALDLRTCVICWAQHGRVFKTAQKMATHPNCRCVMVPVFAGEPQQETGSKIFKALSPAQQKTILGPRRFDRYNDGARLADFVGTYKNAFGPGRRVKPLSEVKYKSIGGLAPEPKPIIKPAVTPKPASLAAAPAEVDFNFASIQAAESWASAAYPDIVFDFAKTDLIVLNPTLKEFDRLAKEWPEVAARLRYVGTYAKKPVPYSDRLTIDPTVKGPYKKWLRFGSGIAHASTDGRRIGINPRWYGKVKEMADALNHSEKTNFLVSNELTSTFTHEFGHQIDHYFESIKYKGVAAVVENNHRAPIGSMQWIYSQVRSQIAKLPKVSTYAKKNIAELMAETFSASVYKPGQDATKALTRFHDVFRKLKIYETSDYKLDYQATAAEKAAAQKEINKILDDLGIEQKITLWNEKK